MSDCECCDRTINVLRSLELLLLLVVVVEAMVEHGPLALVLMRAVKGNVFPLNRCESFQVVQEVEVVIVEVG